MLGKSSVGLLDSSFTDTVNLVGVPKALGQKSEPCFLKITSFHGSKKLLISDMLKHEEERKKPRRSSTSLGNGFLSSGYVICNNPPHKRCK